MNTNQKNTGFGLVETIVALGLFLIIASTGITTVLHSYSVNRLSKEQTQATLLAQEGIEAAQNIKKSNWSNISSGTYGLDNSGGNWTFSGSSETLGDFTRQITISPAQRDGGGNIIESGGTVDPHTFKITSSVNWNFTDTRNNTISLDTYFTNWEKTISNSNIRATEYYIGSGYTGTSYTLTLNQDLSQNYFVIIEGSDGNGGSTGNYGPDENYTRLTADPFGSGALGTTASSNQLEFQRGNSVSGTSWIGVATVVECVSNCDTDGFQLLDVESVTHNGSDTSGSLTTSSWTDIDQIMLMGGFNGPGCYTTESNNSRQKVCHTRIFPSGTDNIEWTRDSGGTTLTTATSTVMVIDWGDNWTIQRENITGNNGGNGANATGEYETATINSIARNNTWVWGVGHTADNGIGDAAEATLITLGDGVNQNTNETQLSIGQEYSDQKSFEVYALTHPNLQVDYRFKTDGDSGSLIYDQTVDDSAGSTNRMALVYNGTNGTGTAYPRPFFSARYLDDYTVRLERRRSGQNFPAWIQAINFENI